MTKNKSDKSELNPGSEEAIKKGCTCPLFDNHKGQGVPSKGGRLFWINEICPLHSKKCMPKRKKK